MTSDQWPEDENDLTDEQVFKMWEERVPVRLRWMEISGSPTWLHEMGTWGFGDTAFTFRFELDHGEFRKVSERAEPIPEEVAQAS